MAYTVIRPRVVAVTQLKEFFRWFRYPCQQSLYTDEKVFKKWPWLVWSIDYLAISRIDLDTGKEVLVWVAPGAQDKVYRLMREAHMVRSKIKSMMKVRT